MVTKNDNPHIAIKKETKDGLDLVIKNKKETYDDIIQRLLNGRIDIKNGVKK